MICVFGGSKQTTFMFAIFCVMFGGGSVSEVSTPAGLTNGPSVLSPHPVKNVTPGFGVQDDRLSPQGQRAEHIFHHPVAAHGLG